MRIALMWRAVLLSLVLFGLALQPATAQTVTPPAPTGTPVQTGPNSPTLQAVQPVLKIAGTNEQNNISLQQSGLTVTQSLNVLETGGQIQSGAFTYTVSTTELRSDTDGNNAPEASLALTTTPDSGALAPFQNTAITLVGTAPRAGTYTGQLFLQVRDGTGVVRSQTAYNLQIQVIVATPQLDVSQPKLVDGAMNFATNSSIITSSIYLVETSNQDFTGPVTATVTFSQLAAANTNTAVTVFTPTFTIQPKQATNVDFSAKLPEVDKYQGVVTIKYGAKVNTYPVNITRNPPASAQLTMTVTSEGNVSREWGFFQNKDLKLNIQVRETAGKTAVYYQPKPDIQPRPGGWCYDQDSDSCKPSNTSTIVSETIAPGATNSYVLEIKSVQQIGNLKGKLILTTPDGGYTEAPFEVNIKDGIALPLVVILLGILLAFGSRRYLNLGRPKLRRRMQLRMAYDQLMLNMNGNDPYYPVFMAWFNQMDQRNQAEMIKQADFDTEISKLGDRFKNYIYIRDVLALLPHLSDYVQDENERKKFVTDFQNIQDDLNRDNLAALDGDGPKSLYVRATKLFDDLVKESTTEVSEAVDGLAKAVKDSLTVIGKAEKEQTPLPEKLQNLKKDLTTLSGNVTQLASEVSTPAPSSLAALDQHTKFILKYKPLNEKYQVLAGSAVTELTAWLNVYLLKQKKGDKVALIHDLLEKGKDEAGHQDPNKKISDADTTFNAKIDEILGKLKDNAANSTKTAQVKLTAIAGLIDEWDTFNNPNPQIKVAGFTDGKVFHPGEILSGNIPFLGALFGTIRKPRQIGFQAPEFNTLNKELSRWDWVVAVVLAFVSVALGLQLLWANNNTFGSGSDYLGIFLWGFGLNQISLTNTALLGSLAGMNPWTMGDDAKAGGGSNS